LHILEKQDDKATFTAVGTRSQIVTHRITAVDNDVYYSGNDDNWTLQLC